MRAGRYLRVSVSLWEASQSKEGEIDMMVGQWQKKPLGLLQTRVMGDEEGTGIQFGNLSGGGERTSDRSRRDRLSGLI